MNTKELVKKKIRLEEEALNLSLKAIDAEGTDEDQAAYEAWRAKEAEILDVQDALDKAIESAA